MKLGGSLERRRKRGSRRASPHDEGEAGGGGPERLVGLGLGLAVVGWLLGYVVATQVVFPAPPPPGDLYEIPDLRGLEVSTARERLEGARLALGEVDSIAHPTVEASRIIGQSPLPGQVALADGAVRVTVSLGPQTRSVPDVRGLTAEQAVIVLEASGFVVETDSAEAEEPRGRVVDIDPPPDRMVALPAGVEILISTGPPLVPVPLVLGMEEAEARATLESLGLIVSEVEEVFRFGRDQGIVVEQEPAADTELQRGGEVRLAVGRRGGAGEQ